MYSNLRLHQYITAAAAKSLQSCPTLCHPIDSSPPGSPVPGILQARTQEWVAISFSSAWKWKVKVKSLSRVRLFTTPWTAAYQAPPSMGFARQEYSSGVPLPSPLCSNCPVVYFDELKLPSPNYNGSIILLSDLLHRGYLSYLVFYINFSLSSLWEILLGIGLQFHWI